MLRYRLVGKSNLAFINISREGGTRHTGKEYVPQRKYSVGVAQPDSLRFSDRIDHLYAALLTLAKDFSGEQHFQGMMYA